MVSLAEALAGWAQLGACYQLIACTADGALLATGSKEKADSLRACL